jgi:hypothetical protein
MFYQSIILLIFRPFRHLVLSAFSETPRQIVTTAAIEICTVFSYYRNARFDTHSPGLIPHILLSAALVLLQENNTQTSIGSFDELRPMSSVVADNLEQCILDLRKMSSTWDLASQTLHVIWSRAANIDLPPRVKKALYPETSSSLALTQHFSFNPVVGLAGSSDQKMVEFNCDGYLEPSHNVEGFDGLGFAAGMGSGSDNAWLKTSGDEFQMAASVASLLEEVGCDVDLQLNAWDSYSV